MVVFSFPRCSISFGGEEFFSAVEARFTPASHHRCWREDREAKDPEYERGQSMHVLGHDEATSASIAREQSMRV
jgi:hypothetical protein